MQFDRRPQTYKRAYLRICAGYPVSRNRITVLRFHGTDHQADLLQFRFGRRPRQTLYIRHLDHCWSA
jgi:hypothetical protein